MVPARVESPFAAIAGERAPNKNLALFVICSGTAGTDSLSETGDRGGGADRPRAGMDDAVSVCLSGSLCRRLPAPPESSVRPPSGVPRWEWAGPDLNLQLQGEFRRSRACRIDHLHVDSMVQWAGRVGPFRHDSC